MRTKRNRVRRLAAVVALIAGVTLAEGRAQAVDKTWAVFDSKQAMEATAHFRQAKAALEKQLEERRATLEAKKKELEERREQLEAKKAVASSAGLVDQEGALVKEEQQLAQIAMRSQRELALFEQKIKEQLFSRLEVAVQVVANQRGHTFVVDAGKVLYHVPAIDITDEVVKSYDTRFGDKPLDLTAVELSQANGAGEQSPNRRQ